MSISDQQFEILVSQSLQKFLEFAVQILIIVDENVLGVGENKASHTMPPKTDDNHYGINASVLLGGPAGLRKPQKGSPSIFKYEDQ